jgi:hypothetical protein
MEDHLSFVFSLSSLSFFFSFLLKSFSSFSLFAPFGLLHTFFPSNEQDCCSSILYFDPCSACGLIAKSLASVMSHELDMYTPAVKIVMCQNIEKFGREFSLICLVQLLEGKTWRSGKIVVV